MKAAYDPADPQSLLNFAAPLTGKTLRDFMTESEITDLVENSNNKGDLGTLVELYYFHCSPGNAAEPDFPEAGVELKTAAVKPHKKKKFTAKERLSLTAINFSKIIEETWDTNTLMTKCSLLLLLFTLYEKNIKMIDRRFLTDPILWSFPDKDLAVIRSDWEKIMQTVLDGKAEELSERHTLYLGAAPKGKNSKDLVKQPRSDVRAMKRGFALKASYVNNAILFENKFAGNIASILKPEDNGQDFETVVISRLQKFIGRNDYELRDELAPEMGKSKNFHARLAYRMLGLKKNHAEEFEKAGIEIKSIRLNTNGTPSQDMSFPNFSYMDIINETWEESGFKEKLDRRFLFMIYQIQSDKTVTFKKAQFWSIPHKDFIEAKRVWEETVQRIRDYNAGNLPKKKFSHVVHVRNHSAKSKDPKYHIPSPQGQNFAVMCFWLNMLYLKEQIK